MSIRPISVLVELLVTSYHFICDSLNIECNLITFCNDVLVPLLLKYFDSGKLVNFGTEDGLCFDPCFDFSSLNDIEDLLFLHFKYLYKYITKSQHSFDVKSGPELVKRLIIRSMMYIITQTRVKNFYSRYATYCFKA